MKTIIKKVTFGLELDEQLKEQARNTEGFVRFIDDEYFEIEVKSNDDKDFVYFKRNNGEIVVA